MSTPAVDEKCCNAFFLVAATHEKERGNMALVTEEVSFFLSSAGRLRIAGHEHIVKSPVLINTSITQKGEGLLWFVEKVVAEKPQQAAKGLVLKLSKRQKTA